MACTSTGANDRRRNQYAKILSLDTLTAKIAACAESYNIPGLLAAADARTGIIPRGDFMTTVDLEHPHVWLSRYMEAVEARYAFVVTRFLSEMPGAFEDCRELAREEGRHNAQENFADMQEALTYYTQNVLDGMPCDHTMEVTRMTDNEVCWQRSMDMHTAFWQEVGGNADNYYDLLTAYVDGLFEKSGIRFEESGHESFRLYR